MGSAWTPPPWGGGMTDSEKEAPSPHVLPHKFGSSVSRGVCINRREPQNCGVVGYRPLEVGAWLTP